jgi:iron complex transport system substrate-binding protein
MDKHSIGEELRLRIKIASLLSFLLILAGCGVVDAAESPTVRQDMLTVTESSGGAVSVKKSPGTVLALSSSVAEIWILAGGELAGVTDDATDGRLQLPEGIEILGTVKDPVIENILALEPDFVLLSEDIVSHAAVAETLGQAGIPCYAAKVDTLEEYLKVLKDFTTITGDAASYEANGESVRLEVEELLSRLDDTASLPAASALFLRAFSTGVKPKAYEHTVCTILDDIGVQNIAAKEGFPLEDISIEAVIEADPQYIFVVPMGDEAAAMETLEDSLLSNPAFAALSAVKTDKLVWLPKNLYHYKPNHRWGEAYEHILQIIYPQAYPEG